MPRPHPFVALALCALPLLACGGEGGSSATFTVDTLPGGIPRTMSSAPAAPGSLALVPVRDIQPEPDSPEEILNPQSVAIADDGSVLVSEQGQGQIKVFGPDGSYQRTIGRRGSGPNEYQVAFIALRGDTLLVQDPQGSRFSRVLWRSGEFLNQLVSVCCYWTNINVDGDGHAWIYSIAQAPDTTFPHSQGFLRIPATSGPVDSLWAYERKDIPEPPYWDIRQGDQLQMRMAIPHQPRVHFVPDPTGRLLTGWSGEYSIRESTDGRDTVAIFGRAWTPEPVAASEKQELVDEMIRRQLEGNRSGPDEATYRNAYDPSLIPNTRPAYGTIFVDRSGRRWLQLSSADTTQVQFDVFARDGRWLDTVRLPRSQWPATSFRTSWGRGEVAVAMEDEDGLPLVRVFAIRER